MLENLLMISLLAGAAVAAPEGDACKTNKCCILVQRAPCREVVSIHKKFRARFERDQKKRAAAAGAQTACSDSIDDKEPKNFVARCEQKVCVAKPRENR